MLNLIMATQRIMWYDFTVSCSWRRIQCLPQAYQAPLVLKILRLFRYGVGNLLLEKQRKDLRGRISDVVA